MWRDSKVHSSKVDHNFFSEFCIPNSEFTLPYTLYHWLFAPRAEHLLPSHLLTFLPSFFPVLRPFTLCSLRHALCLLLAITVSHLLTFSPSHLPTRHILVLSVLITQSCFFPPSHLLTFSTSHLPGLSSTPATRTPQPALRSPHLATRNPHIVPRSSHLATRNPPYASAALIRSRFI